MFRRHNHIKPRRRTKRVHAPAIHPIVTSAGRPATSPICRGPFEGGTAAEDGVSRGSSGTSSGTSKARRLKDDPPLTPCTPRNRSSSRLAPGGQRARLVTITTPYGPLTSHAAHRPAASAAVLCRTLRHKTIPPKTAESAPQFPLCYRFAYARARAFPHVTRPARLAKNPRKTGGRLLRALRCRASVEISAGTKTAKPQQFGAQVEICPSDKRGNA